MTTYSFSPTSTLTSADDQRFVLFEHNWLTLQTFITSALKLPVSVGDFTEKYGEFPSSERLLIEGCVGAMRDVAELSARFGDPESIRLQITLDPNVLGSTDAPDDLYTHMVWLANKIQNQASSFAFTYGNLAPVLQGTKEENAAALTMLLTGPGGLCSTAEAANEQAVTLISKLGSFANDFSDANNVMRAYTNSESSILAVANSSLVDLEGLLATTSAACDAAYREWKDYTIAAATTSVGLFVLSFGILWPVSAITGGVLGHLAETARGQYNNLCATLANYERDVLLKTALVSDLTGLNEAMIYTQPAMDTFEASMNEIMGVWSGINADLLYIVNNYGPEQLGDLSWLIQTMNILDAQNKWQAISDQAQMFVQGSMVSFSGGAFGALATA